MEIRFNKITTSVVVILSVMIILALFIPSPFLHIPQEKLTPQLTNDTFYNRMIEKLFLFFVVPFCIAYLLITSRPINTLGLSSRFTKALAWAFVITLSILIGFLIFIHYSDVVNPGHVVAGAAVAGFTEEVLFRGFMFGLLFRFCKWGFIPAVLITSLIFGAAHFSQGHSMGNSLSVFGITFAGSLWFSWLYVEWRYNLWIPVFTHFFMNLYWDLFKISDNATGNMTAAIIRIITVIISIVITNRLIKKESRMRIITRKSLWIHEPGINY